MKLYFACAGQVIEASPELLMHLESKGAEWYELRSYFGIDKFAGHTLPIYGKDFFLDSGAFSACMQSKALNIDEYADFVKRYKDQIHIYANLDDINFGSDPEIAKMRAEITWRNQQYLESKGLNPIPVFHMHEPWEYLERYVRNYDYIALGGLTSQTRGLDEYFDVVWRDFLSDSQGKPKVKVHAFGMNNQDCILKYPWYSSDSSSWLIQARTGAMLVPAHSADGSPDYQNKPMHVFISNRSGNRKWFGWHWDTMPDDERHIVELYCKKKGFTVEFLAENMWARLAMNMEYTIDLGKYGEFAETFTSMRQVELL